MIRFVGLDVHKRIVEVAILSEAGEILSRARIPCTRDDLTRFAQDRLTREDRAALEATSNTWGVVPLLKPFVASVTVSNPLRTKAIAQAKIKTDKVDAVALAQLLRCDYLPTVWEPDEPTQHLRRLTSRRAALVADRTAVKNRIHSVLHQRLIVAPCQDLFGPKGLAWLRTLSLDGEGRMALDSDLRLLMAIQKEIDLLDQLMAKKGYAEPRVKLLMTLPGVDRAVAQTLLAALGDVSRFPSPDHAAGYLGLVPSTKQSADHCYHGPITKHGNSHARWMMIQAAQHLATHPGPLGVFFRRLSRKKNRNVAVVATARKLVSIAQRMLSRNEPYRYAQPQATRSKLLRLRIQATGLRRQGGTPKGSPRPASYGSGQGTRRIPSLPELYQSEGLPQPTSPTTLPSGEKRALRSAAVTRFVQSIQRAHRVPRVSLKSKQEAPDASPSQS